RDIILKLFSLFLPASKTWLTTDGVLRCFHTYRCSRFSLNVAIAVTFSAGMFLFHTALSNEQNPLKNLFTLSPVVVLEVIYFKNH
uniref:Uncharacterized protein n=1 Tax=Poecilia reticulata TaxID=8081 RepID=A0A3P9NYY1_POERE